MAIPFTMQLTKLACVFLLLGLAIGSDPSWQETVDESREVSRLSDRIQQNDMMIARWRRKHADARHYHEGQKKLIKKQIAIRKQQNEVHEESNADYESSKEEQYKYRMCAMILDAFYFSDGEEEQEAKVKVLHYCMGRKSMALFAAAAPGPHRFPVKKSHRHLRAQASSEGRHRSAAATHTVEVWDDIVDQRLEHRLLQVERSFQSTVVEMRGLEKHCSEKGGCSSAVAGPVQDMEAKLERQERELEAVRREYHEDQQRWRAERAELRREEGDLGDDATQTHYDKQAARHRAWEKVKGDFCPVINQHYGLDEEKIVEFAMEECQ